MHKSVTHLIKIIIQYNHIFISVNQLFNFKYWLNYTIYYTLNVTHLQIISEWQVLGVGEIYRSCRLLADPTVLEV